MHHSNVYENKNQIHSYANDIMDFNRILFARCCCCCWCGFFFACLFVRLSYSHLGSWGIIRKEAVFFLLLFNNKTILAACSGWRKPKCTYIQENSLNKTETKTDKKEKSLYHKHRFHCIGDCVMLFRHY